MSGIVTNDNGKRQTANSKQSKEDAMSDLIYNHARKNIILRDQEGQTIGTWPANNNVDSHVGLASLPNGVYQIKDTDVPHTHSGDNSNGGYGPTGIIRLKDFYFDKMPHTAVGIHSGRKHVRDKAGRAGIDHATKLCVRTTDEAMSMIRATMRHDSLRTLLVEKSAVRHGFVKTAIQHTESSRSDDFDVNVSGTTVRSL
jgi:hypothetical protein